MVLIVTRYLIGEVRSIEGYVKEEIMAKEKVKELNRETELLDEDFYYEYLSLNELV